MRIAVRAVGMIAAAVVGISGLTAVPAAAGSVTSAGPVAMSISSLGNCPSRVLKYGSRGECVEIVQSLLNFLFDAGLAQDGSFGPATEKAVKKFQKRYGLQRDGVVGPKTWSQLAWCEMRWLNGWPY